MSKETTNGHIIQVVGVVIDVEFNNKKLPRMYEALHVMLNGKVVTLEVAQHLDERTVRTIALSGTDGLRRGDEVTATGAAISVPVGAGTQGRMFNVTGDPIDGQPAPKGPKAKSWKRVLRLSTSLLHFLKVARPASSLVLVSVRPCLFRN
jgi:F-type H+-transporting ATPase subunit beta